jgi:imidazolonepropionase-like amidohydrolase
VPVCFCDDIWPDALGTNVAPFISINAPVFALNHLRVIDGTGAAAREDLMVVIANGKIQSIGPSASLQPPKDAQVLDRAGYTVIPGLVRMHNHLYYTVSFQHFLPTL